MDQNYKCDMENHFALGQAGGGGVTYSQPSPTPFWYKRYNMGDRGVFVQVKIVCMA
jgi:hypothetical protein